MTLQNAGIGKAHLCNIGVRHIQEGRTLLLQLRQRVVRAGHPAGPMQAIPAAWQMVPCARKWIVIIISFAIFESCINEYINGWMRREACVTGTASKVTLPASPCTRAGLMLVVRGLWRLFGQTRKILPVPDPSLCKDACGTFNLRELHRHTEEGRTYVYRSQVSRYRRTNLMTMAYESSECLHALITNELELGSLPSGLMAGHVVPRAQYIMLSLCI